MLFIGWRKKLKRNVRNRALNRYIVMSLVTRGSRKRKKLIKKNSELKKKTKILFASHLPGHSFTKITRKNPCLQWTILRFFFQSQWNSQHFNVLNQFATQWHQQPFPMSTNDDSKLCEKKPTWITTADRSKFPLYIELEELTKFYENYSTFFCC